MTSCVQAAHVRWCTSIIMPGQIMAFPPQRNPCETWWAPSRTSRHRKPGRPWCTAAQVGLLKAFLETHPQVVERDMMFVQVLCPLKSRAWGTGIPGAQAPFQALALPKPCRKHHRSRGCLMALLWLLVTCTHYGTAVQNLLPAACAARQTNAFKVWLLGCGSDTI